jgi:hypothetical protein
MATGSESQCRLQDYSRILVEPALFSTVRKLGRAMNEEGRGAEKHLNTWICPVALAPEVELGG